MAFLRPTFLITSKFSHAQDIWLDIFIGIHLDHDAIRKFFPRHVHLFCSFPLFSFSISLLYCTSLSLSLLCIPPCSSPIHLSLPLSLSLSLSLHLPLYLSFSFSFIFFLCISFSTLFLSFKLYFSLRCFLQLKFIIIIQPKSAHFYCTSEIKGKYGW